MCSSRSILSRRIAYMVMLSIAVELKLVIQANTLTIFMPTLQGRFQSYYFFFFFCLMCTVWSFTVYFSTIAIEMQNIILNTGKATTGIFQYGWIEISLNRSFLYKFRHSCYSQLWTSQLWEIFSSKIYLKTQQKAWAIARWNIFLYFNNDIVVSSIPDWSRVQSTRYAGEHNNNYYHQFHSEWHFITAWFLLSQF